jgi:acetyl esterase/lipase
MFARKFSAVPMALTLAALALTRSLCGQAVDEFPLRSSAESNAPATTEEVVYRHNNYDDRGFNRVVQKIAVPTLTVYRPAKSAHRGAALVVCPGGGYSYVAIDREGHAFGRYFAERGMTVAVLKYRLPAPELTKDALPLPQQDALEAVRFVRAHAAEWNVDARRVGILGCSAGGHLAGSVGILGDAAGGSRPDFVALLYPVVCMDGPFVHQGSRTKLLGPSPAPERAAEFSLERRARSGLPPFFIVHAKDDKGVPPQNSELLAAALKEKGVPAELRLVETGGHGFGLGRGPGSDSAQWMEAFLQWLDRLP